MKTGLVLVFLFAGISISDPPTPLWSRFGEIVTIDSPVNGDVYVGGQTVTINAPIRGDLVVAGGTVVINDSVTMDVLVAGGNVTINGYVGDDVRCGAGSLAITGQVRGDVMVSGGEVVLKNGSDLNGNLIAAGGDLEIDGVINGNARVTGGVVNLHGIIDGSADIKAETMSIAGTIRGDAILAANTIIVAPMAEFDKTIGFWNDDHSLIIPTDVPHGAVTFDNTLEVRSGRWELLGFASALILIWYLGTALVMIWLLEYLFSNTFSKAAKIVLNQSVRSMGYGFLFFVGVPLICVVLSVTVLAIPIAVILGIAYIVLIILATAITSIIISNWLNEVYYKSQWQIARIILVSFGVFVILKLLTLTPIIGPIIMGLMICMAFGAILINTRKNFAEKVV